MGAARNVDTEQAKKLSSGTPDHTTSVQLNGEPYRSVSSDHPATSHPWGRSLRKRDPRSWSRHQRIEAPLVEEEKPRDVTAAEREGAPFLVGLSGANPERVERMRAGYWPTWAQ